MRPPPADLFQPLRVDHFASVHAERELRDRDRTGGRRHFDLGDASPIRVGPDHHAGAATDERAGSRAARARHRRGTRFPPGGRRRGFEDVDQSRVGRVIETELNRIDSRRRRGFVEDRFQGEVLLPLDRRPHDVAAQAAASGVGGEIRDRKRLLEHVRDLVVGPLGRDPVAGLGPHGRCACDCRRGISLQQIDRSNHHSALTVAALRHLLVDPGLLNRMQDLPGPSCWVLLDPQCRQPLDRVHPLADDESDGRDARPHLFSVHEHGAGAALRHATPEPWAAQEQLVPQDVEQRRVGCRRHCPSSTVHRERECVRHAGSSRPVSVAEPAGTFLWARFRSPTRMYRGCAFARRDRSSGVPWTTVDAYNNV